MSNLHVSYEVPNLRVGVWPANADLSSDQFCGMTLAAATTGVDGYAGAALALPSASGAAILGILQDNPKQNVAGDVWMQGISKAQISGTVAIGAILKVDTNGKFLTAGTGDYGVAMAMCAGSSGDVIAVWVHNFGKQ